MSQQLVNVTGVHGLTSLDQTASRTVETYEASGAISKYDVVVFDAVTADANVTVAQADVSDDDVALVAGVALNATTASGETVQVVTHGPTIVSVGDATIAVGDQAHFHASTDGAADGTDADATTVAGDVFGVFLSANDVPDTDQAVVFVH